MTAVLQTWCNEILQLSRPVQNVEADFANGYLFGEILYKHNQLEQPSFTNFRDNYHANTILQNFTILESIFHRIGIKLNARTVAAIINQKPQTAQRILYELKTKLTIFERVVVGYAPSSSSSSSGGNINDGPIPLALTETAYSYSNDEHKKILARLQLKAPKPSYEIASQQIFSKAVRTLGGNQREKDMAKYLSVFTNDKFQQYIREIDLYNQAVVQATRNYYDRFRHNRRQRMAQQVDNERKTMEKGANEWAKNQTVRISTERQQRYIRARLEAEKVERKRAINTAAAEDLDLGTDEFTHITAVQGYDIQPNRSTIETLRVNQAPPSSTLRRDEFVAELNSRLGDPEGAPETLYRESKHASAAILNRLQNRSVAEKEAQSIRRRRRAAVLSSIETGLEHNLGQARLESLKSAVMAPSVPEVALMAAVSSVLRTERAFITRRAELESQIEYQANATNWAELERQRSIFHDLRAEHDRAVELALFTYDRALAARVAAESSAAADLANTLLRKVLDFALEVTRQRELRRGSPNAVGTALTGLRKQREHFTQNRHLSSNSDGKDSENNHPHSNGNGNHEEKKGDNETFVDPTTEFDDGEQYHTNGLYDLPVSVYRDLQIIFSSRYPITTTIPDVSLQRPLSSLSTTDVDNLANTVLPINGSVSNETTASHATANPVSHDTTTKDHRPPTANRRGSVSAAPVPAPVDTSAVINQRHEEQQKIISSYLTNETNASLALLPIAGNRGNLQDHEFMGQVRTMQAIHGNSAVDGKSYALLLEGTQALLDACSLRDYLVNMGAWSQPDVRSANITHGILDEIETVIIKLSRNASNSYKGGLTALFPDLFGHPSDASTVPKPVPETISEPSKTATGRRSSVSTPAPVPVTVVPDTPTVSMSPFGIDNLPIVPRAANYTSERDQKINHVLHEQSTHPLLGSPYLHYALLEDASIAADVFGHVIRNVTTAAEKVSTTDEETTNASVTYPHRFPLTVALIGPPHTGKLVQANRLAEAFRLAIIHPQALIGRGIALAWPSSKARSKALNEEQISRPSSRASIGTPLGNTVNSSVMDTSVTITATNGTNNNRRPNSAGRSRTPPRVLPAFGLDSAQTKFDRSSNGLSGSMVDDSTENSLLLVDGQVIRTSDGPTTVPMVLSPVLPVDPRFLTPFFDSHLRAIGNEILNSSAVIPMDGGTYRDLPPGVGAGTVDAHIDWTKISETYFLNMVISAIEYLARTPDNVTGWLLVDYPTTPDQAAKLEEKLTGWQAPPDVSGNYSGDGLRSPVPLAKAEQIRTTANEILATALPSSSKGTSDSSSSSGDQAIYSSLNDALLGTAAAVKDDETYWSSLMAPVPDPLGLPIASQKFDITWPHGIDIVLRIDTTPDRILRRALGWKTDIATLSTNTVWDNGNRINGTNGTNNFSKGNNSMIESTPDCPIAAVLTGELGIDLPNQMNIIAKDRKAGKVNTGNDTNNAHLPSIYHTDAIPPHYVHETIDNFIPVAAYDLAYRPGAEGSRVVTTGVDIAELGSVIASAAEKWDAAVPALDSWYGRGNNLRIIRNWTKRKGPLRFRNTSSNTNEPSVFNTHEVSPLGSGVVSAVDDIGPGGESMPNQPSSSIPTLDDNVYGSNENVTYPSGSNNMLLNSGGVYGIYSESKEEMIEELDEDDNTSNQETLDGDSVVLTGHRPLPNNSSRNNNTTTTNHPSSSVNRTSPGPDHSGAVLSAGEWNPVRFDLLNESELYIRLSNALQAGIHAKEAAEIARKDAKEAADAALQAQITAFNSKRNRANRLRSGADVALNEFMVKAGDEAKHVIAQRKAAEEAALHAHQEREAKENEEEGGEIIELPPMEPVKLDTSPLPTIPTVDTDVFTVPPFKDLVCMDPVTHRLVPPPLPDSVVRPLPVEPENGTITVMTTASKVKFTDEKMFTTLVAPKLPENIPLSLPIVLSRAWKNCVNKYTTTFKINTRTIRTMEAAAVSRLALVRRRLQAYLVRPCSDLNVPLVHFQRHWNDIGLLGATKAGSTNTLGVLAEAENILRSNSDGENDIVRTEALMRLEETLAIMWDGVDNREAEALTRLAALRADNWIQHAQTIAINTYAQLLQAEAERFDTTRSILCDYYTGAEGAILSDFLCTAAQDAVDRAQRSASNEASLLLEASSKIGTNNSNNGRRASVSKETVATKPGSKPPSAGKEKPVPTAGKPPTKGGKEVEPEPVHDDVPVPKDPLAIDESILRAAVEGTELHNLLAEAFLTFATEFTITIPSVVPSYTVSTNTSVTASATTEAVDPKRAASAGKKPGAAPATGTPKPGAAPTKAPVKSAKEEAAEKAAAEQAAKEAADKAAHEAALEAAERIRNPEPASSTAKAVYAPLKSFVTAVRKAMAIADAAVGATELLAIAQVLAREKRIANDRSFYQSLITKQRNLETEATNAAIAAATAAIAAAEQAANPKDTKGKGATNTSSKQSRPASGAKDGKNAPVVPTSTNPPAVALAIDVPPPKPIDEIISSTVVPSPTAATLVDEGFFLALRYEINNYRNRILAILRHATVHITRIAGQGEACYQNIYADILRSSLAEGATVEAFGELAKQAIVQGVPLPHDLRIEYNADCVAFLVDKTTRVYTDPVPPTESSINNGVPALPLYSSILERGDMLADIDSASSMNNDTNKASTDDGSVLHRFMSCLTPSQIARVAQAIKDAAITYTADASGPYGLNGVTPPSALPSHVFIDTLVRLGASGSLPPEWTQATLQATSFKPSDHASKEKDNNTSSSSSLFSPFHALADRFLITVAAEGTAAAAAALTGDVAGSMIDDVVDWRLFILSLCFTGPAEDIPEPMSLAYRRTLSSSSSSEAGKNSTVIVSPLSYGVASGISTIPTVKQIKELYNFTTQQAELDNDDGFGSSSTEPNMIKTKDDDITNEYSSSSSTAFESILLPRTILETIPLWYEGTGLYNNLKDNNNQLITYPKEVTSAVLSTLQSTVTKEYNSSIQLAQDEAGKLITQSVVTGDAIIKKVMFDTFSMPAGAVLNDPGQLTIQGLEASDELIDLGAFCSTLIKLADK